MQRLRRATCIERLQLRRRRVNRWFNRSRYDTAVELQRFGSRLRDEPDLDGLSDDLRALVAGTMQPAYVGLLLVDRGAAQEAPSESST